MNLWVEYGIFIFGNSFENDVVIHNENDLNYNDDTYVIITNTNKNIISIDHK